MKLSIGIFLSVVVVVLLQVVRVSTLQTQSFGITDYSAFFSAARIIQSGDRKDLYSLSRQYKEHKKMFPPLLYKDFLPFFYLPVFAYFLTLFTNMSYIYSYLFTTGFLFFVLLVSFFFFVHYFTKNHKNTQLSLVISTYAGFLPLWHSIVNTQFSLIWVCIVLISYILYNRNKYFFSGLFLSLLLVKPQFILFPILLLFFLKKKKQFFYGFFAGCFILVTMSIITVGLEGIKKYIDLLYLLPSVGNQYRLGLTVQPTIRGLLFSIKPSYFSVSLFLSLWLIISVLIVAIVFFRIRDKKVAPHFIWTISLSLYLICCPHLHLHDYTLLLFPVILYSKNISLFLLKIPIRKYLFSNESAIGLLAFILSSLFTFLWLFLPQLACVCIVIFVFVLLFHHDTLHLH